MTVQGPKFKGSETFRLILVSRSPCPAAFSNSGKFHIPHSAFHLTPHPSRRSRTSWLLYQSQTQNPELRTSLPISPSLFHLRQFHIHHSSFSIPFHPLPLYPNSLPFYPCTPFPLTPSPLPPLSYILAFLSGSNSEPRTQNFPSRPPLPLTPVPLYLPRYPVPVPPTAHIPRYDIFLRANVPLIFSANDSRPSLLAR